MDSSRHIFTLRYPASWHGETWRDALVLGNGLTGVLVPGAIGDESIHFNRFDLWHGGKDMEIPDISDTFRAMRSAIDASDYPAANKDNLMHALKEKGYTVGCETPYPLGWLDLHFEPDGIFRHYRRGINMRTGEAFVSYTVNGCEYRRQMFVSRARDITVVKMTADKPFAITCDFRLFSDAGESIITDNSITRTAADGDTAARVLFLGDFSASCKNGKLCVTGKEYLILIRVSSHSSDCTLSEEQFAGMDYDALLAEHTALHTPLYDAVSIELADDTDHALSNEDMLGAAYDDVCPPALLERLWRFGRYLFISAASDKGTPVPLYGLWHGGDNLKWSQYVANENVQMTYWHTMAGGLAYALPPLIRYYTSRTSVFRECARKVFGMRGIWISAYTTPNAAGLCVPVSVIANWISGAGWLCRHFWDYYLYSGDEALLREEILPFMHEAALFFCDYAVEDGDTIRLYPSVSPENSPASLQKIGVMTASGHHCPVVQNSTMDFAVMKELFANLLTGISVTGMYKDEVPVFESLLKKIPDYQINGDGAVKEWMHPDLDDAYNHRHLSHVYPVFPGNEVTAYNRPALFEAFHRAVDLREIGSQCNWSMPHMSCIYARLHEPKRALECLDMLAKSVVLPSLMTIANDWRNMGISLTWKEPPIQLDANFGVVNALQEMLFCYQNETLSVLPALPDRLKSGCVRGIRFPGGRADIRWTEDGRADVTIYAECAFSYDLYIAGKTFGTVTLQQGESMSFESTGFR
ncbi:MAG: glycoside hydrolase N-terminal domain-containing protein [Clostridia bacterium]|nr:glycoside hydrolase N-terminal domain-containing protein [Clostridia bacterium]